MLRNILFFAHDDELVGLVFQSVFDFVARVPVHRLVIHARRARLGVDRMNPVYLTRSKQVAARMLGGEMMIMSARDSTLFNLNDVGTVIWQAADGRTSLDEIVARLCARI